ncbi:TonB-dependent receptor domain-containing protein [Zunongwangia sp. HRR-M8]|uniref:TonB-dependent receptor domain-containing protein n=1 Tax=Zunongwangia sp. HRR-M8 TaxID=3015170 RepID=UPI0022DE8943|nr:TonB-dependent receptor [Zunongwangia sp. HRR-M8]WBL20816.1 TonB-dependent receptor [Zunongwangia sp. HRR-M8]
MKLFITIIVGLLCFSAISQTKISGKIIENDSTAIPFAEVVLKNVTSGKLIGSITEDDGSFQLNTTPGNYSLEISFVGQQLFTKKIEVKEDAIDLGTIIVDNAQELDEVFLTSKKKLIERKIDRLIFNVENSSKSSQGDVVEVLKIVPSIRVENDAISMIGKGNMRVMIDEQMLQLSGVDLINFLQSIDSETIKSIEVISNPPARYEAEGNSGLINIILKKPKSDSWNAQLKGTYIQRTKANYRSSANFNINKDKFTFSGRLGFIKHQLVLQENLTSTYPEETSVTSTPVDIDLEGSVASAEIGYEMNQNWHLGAQYYFNGTAANIESLPKTKITRNNAEDSFIRMNGSEPQHPRVHKLNLNTNFNLDSLGKNVILNLDYLYNTNEDKKYYQGIESPGLDENTENRYFRSFNKTNNKYDIYSAKIDIENPLKWIDLDFGAKYTYSDISSDIKSFNTGYTLNPTDEIPNIPAVPFDYDEKIASAYISANRNFGEQWSAQFGLRLENTAISALSPNLDINREDNYTNLFPTFYINYNLDTKTNFSLNYSRRIERPNFRDLNPNTYYRTPSIFYSGNAYLDPSFIHNIEFSVLHHDFVTRLYFTRENNAFGEVPIANTSINSTGFSYENYIDRTLLGISESFTWNPIHWWTNVNNLDLNYAKSTFNLEQPQADRNGFNSRVSTNNDFNLNSEKTIIGGLNYWYQFEGVDGIFETQAQSSLGLSLQFLLLDKDLNISLRGEDLFKNAIERKTAKINGVTQEIRNFYDSRQFWLSVSYKFGNDNLKVRSQKSGNTDTERRAGG